MNDFERYSSELKKHYEMKRESYGFDLSTPSSAKLRDLSLYIFDNGLPKNDEMIFRVFFEINKEQDIRQRILQFDLDKFKAVSNFLRGKSEKTNSNSLNLIAILIDFKPRPYSAFRIKNDKRLPILDFNFIENQLVASAPKPNQTILNMGLLLVVFLIVGFATNRIFFPTKNCMQWQSDHYELVDCEGTAAGFGNFNDIKPATNLEVTLKKIEPNKNTIYFKNGIPLVWYRKINDSSIECFNQQGFHPENGKPLKPITNYIIKKYLEH